MRLMDMLANRKLEGKTQFQGLRISIENQKGSIRKGVDKTTGKPWQVRMVYPYGYIRMSMGVDGDHVDCFLGPNQEATHAYVIHQKDPSTGNFDEDKCMLGFDSAEEAKKAYLQNYTTDKFFGSMDAISMAEFKKKVLGTKDRPTKIAAAGWRLGRTLLYAGGPGSGCHGSNCGRKSDK